MSARASDHGDSGGTDDGEEKTYTTLSIGALFMRPDAVSVLEGAGSGYPNVDVNGVASFVKSTYAPRASGAILEHEGAAYAALQHLQGDAIPEMTVQGVDPGLQLRVLGTRMSGIDLVRAGNLKKYGGLLPLYRKAAAALGKIHAAGFVHGSIDGSNILLDKSSEDPVVRFVDLSRAQRALTKTEQDRELDELAHIFDIRDEDDVRETAKTLKRANAKAEKHESKKAKTEVQDPEAKKMEKGGDDAPAELAAKTDANLDDAKPDAKPGVKPDAEVEASTTGKAEASTEASTTGKAAEAYTTKKTPSP